jgi:hypothetical protein
MCRWTIKITTGNRRDAAAALTGGLVELAAGIGLGFALRFLNQPGVGLLAFSGFSAWAVVCVVMIWRDCGADGASSRG